MKRSVCILILVLAIMIGLNLSFSVTTVLAKSKKAEFHWKVQSAWPAGCEMNTVAKHFFDLVRCYSGGRIDYTFHTSGEIVPSFEVWNAVSKGVLDAGHACNCYTIGKVWASAMFCSTPVPVGPQGDVMKILWLYEGGGNNLHDEIVGKHYHVKGFPVSPISTEVFFYSGKEIKSMADLRKMKVRSTGIRAAVLHEVGISTVSLPGGELVPALQKGVVDAVEYSSLWWDWPMGFSDVTKYIYYSKAPMVGVLYGFINKDRWNELPSDLKKAVERAGFDSCLWCAIRTQYEDTKFAHNIGETTNVPVLWLPKDIEDELAAATLRLFEKRSKKDPKVKQVLDSWHKFYIDDNWLYYRQFLNPCQ